MQKSSIVSVTKENFIQKYLINRYTNNVFIVTVYVLKSYPKYFKILDKIIRLKIIIDFVTFVFESKRMRCKKGRKLLVLVNT